MALPTKEEVQEAVAIILQADKNGELTDQHRNLIRAILVDTRIIDTGGTPPNYYEECDE